jgi:hypothetical protein
MPITALDELDERLKANGIYADPTKIASAILGVARNHRWNDRPHEIVAWLEELALNAGQSWTKKHQADN